MNISDKIANEMLILSRLRPRPAPLRPRQSKASAVKIWPQRALRASRTTSLMYTTL